MSIKISSHCTIRDSGITVNGEEKISKGPSASKEFFKWACAELGMDYPHFHRMDGLCKLALLTAYPLLSPLKDREGGLENTGLVLANKSGSLASDIEHQKGIDPPESYASPKVFVYTLANICLGELCIQYGMHAENAFFISEEFDASLQVQYAQSLLEAGKASEILGGWVEFDGEQYNAFLYLTAATGNWDFNENTLQQLYEER